MVDEGRSRAEEAERPRCRHKVEGNNANANASTVNTDAAFLRRVGSVAKQGGRVLVKSPPHPVQDAASSQLGARLVARHETCSPEARAPAALPQVRARGWATRVAPRHGQIPCPRW